MHGPRHFLRGASAALLLVFAVGCRTAEPPDRGVRMGDKTLEQFKPGETSEHWLVSVVGPPTTRTEVAGLGEPVSILRYSIIERSKGGLFSFFVGSPPPKTTATIYFVVRKGTITQFWADREEVPTLLGKKSNEGGEKKE